MPVWMYDSMLSKASANSNQSSHASVSWMWKILPQIVHLIKNKTKNNHLNFQEWPPTELNKILFWAEKVKAELWTAFCPKLNTISFKKTFGEQILSSKPFSLQLDFG